VIWAAGLGGGGGGGGGLVICAVGFGGGGGFGVCDTAPGGGPTRCISGLGGGGGGGAVTTFFLESGTSGLAVLGADVDGDGVTGASFKFGFAAPVAAPDGKGGAPWAPGTGSALGFGKFGGFTVVDKDLPGVAPGAVGTPKAAGLIVGLIDALGGAGSFPCWMSEARCATEGGKEAAAADSAGPPVPGSPFAALGPV
jgi:hypothetical protein